MKHWKTTDIMNINELKYDKRPKKDWWAPGSYGNTCVKCGDGFIGDKRAGVCADCAYDDSFRLFGRLMWKLIQKYGEEFIWDEWSEEVLPLAEKAGLCKRVAYDPEKHGEINADPGCEIWSWGEEESSANNAALDAEEEVRGE